MDCRPCCLDLLHLDAHQLDKLPGSLPDDPVAQGFCCLPAFVVLEDDVGQLLPLYWHGVLLLLVEEHVAHHIPHQPHLLLQLTAVCCGPGIEKQRFDMAGGDRFAESSLLFSLADMRTFAITSQRCNCGAKSINPEENCNMISVTYRWVDVSILGICGLHFVVLGLRHAAHRCGVLHTDTIHISSALYKYPH